MPGDIVLVHDDTPRINWRLAVIKELMEGKDGLVYAAKKNSPNHPIARSIPLQVSSDVTSESGASNSGTDV